ncbi:PLASMODESMATA CALLOSE-BINDING PROTEIN 2 [Gastrolobium bilobum]|uniref:PLASMODESMATA CALLOSE-BINDING PROTEIN 2 n=1 Tax=Gastrolobium bilobum TaxID=150636 RepID=UPI002AAFFFCE|nr:PLASMODESMATA CALLOSE-BINDING PROTEIN 2 [Gastrolobium bilobum]
MAASPKLVCLMLLTAIIVGTKNVMSVDGQGSASWCVARSDASNQALQTALDYACGAGADCFPLQPDGLCFLPNTIQAHASYAFNSFYQRKNRAPGSCDFSGTATIAQSDPSYGSCMYPSATSTAGGPNTPITTPTMNNPNVPSSTTTTPIYGGITPGMGTPFPDNSRASSMAIATSFLAFFFSLLIMSIIS